MRKISKCFALAAIIFALTFTFTTQTAAQGLTSDFRSWINANGYGGYDFARDDLNGYGSYGGKSSPGDSVINQPVIFIHGNSDSAIGRSSAFSGWNDSINYFASQGYKRSEMYATTWGDASPSSSAYQYHSKPNIQKIRAFIQAVKAYTGATKVDIVTHSMGVTLTRKAILGGSGNDSLNGGSYNLGSPITSSVDTFVGIAGANWGLVSCYQTNSSTPTCGATNGLYPGYASGSPPYGLSNI
ncbi:MAG: lipase, partial [Pyrinomonadaceae bacterium]|nr:lipase [Pyrinomonadaceae bacterium]